MAEQIVQIKSLPGVKRDGTKFEGDQYVDGQWVRFQRGLPRKIGGYRSINKFERGLSRAIHEYTQDLLTYIHTGSANYVERFYIDSSNNTSIITDRTPTADFTADENNVWMFDADDIVDTGVATNLLIAQVAPNLSGLSNNTGGELFYGDLLGTAQSGLPPIRIGNLVRDTELMHQARGAAFVLLEKDPALSQPAHVIYKQLMVETRRLELSQVS